eukprot:2318765-Rhodomonas_salina.1
MEADKSTINRSSAAINRGRQGTWAAEASMRLALAFISCTPAPRSPRRHRHKWERCHHKRRHAVCA